jgi:hypothetical protein
LISIDIPFLFAVEELYGTQYQSGSFSLINVGSGSIPARIHRTAGGGIYICADTKHKKAFGCTRLLELEYFCMLQSTQQFSLPE